MAVDVVKALQDLIQDILGNRAAAAQYAEDPGGTLAAQGITEGDLDGLDMPGLVADACAGLDLPESTRSALQSYTSGSGGSSGGMSAPPPAAHSVGQVMQHLNYVTYVAYEGDEIIQQEITNIDQSQNVDVDVEGDLHGDISVDSHDVNANATGDGSAASGYGPATAGDENLVNTGTMSGQQNTGGFTGVQAGGSVEDTVVGDNNQTANLDIDTSATGGTATSTGGAGASDGRHGGSAGAGGDVSTGDTVGGSVGDINLNFGGGDQTNLDDVSADDGGAIALGGDATGSSDDTTLTDVGNVTETSSQIQLAGDDITNQTEQGPGDATQDTGLDFPDRLEHAQLAEAMDNGPDTPVDDNPDPGI